jgi:hypothetical protein
MKPIRDFIYAIRRAFDAGRREWSRVRRNQAVRQYAIGDDF